MLIERCDKPDCLSCELREKWRIRKKAQRDKKREERILAIINANLEEKANDEANRK